MRSIVKLPLYLGLVVVVAAVILSAVKLGNQQAFTNLNSRANVAGAVLMLKYTAPNLVSVLLTSDKEISGADVTVKFNSDKITVLPSSLTAGADFVTSGGNVDKSTSTFTFSAISKKPSVKSGVVATFTVKPKEGLTTADADLQFSAATAVIDRASGQNILSQTQGVKFTVSSP